jgi:hypothetical protein
MVRSILFTLVAILVLLALDYYVYRNWRDFVAYREEAERTPTFRGTLPVYRVLMVLMPLTLPVYFLFSDWWDVEPKLVRGAFLALWALYYVPKAVLALALLIKDAARFIVWLFGWFQEKLSATPSAAANEERDAALDLSDMKRASRRHFLREIGWSAASVPFVVVGYSVFRTLYDFEVHRVDVPIVGLPRPLEGLTIGQLSDLHAGSFFSERPMQEAVSVLQAERPDVITLTGDYVNHDAAEFGLIRSAVQQLHADLGVYGCLGNHDHYANVADVITQVRDTPVDLLINEHRTLAIDGARLHLVGVDNTGFYQDFSDMDAAVAGLDERPGDDLRLVLAHTPTYWDEQVRPHYPAMDLMLCGHTHGGQLGIEVGPVRYSLARVAYPRWAGLYAEPRPGGDEHFLYVNRGVGTVGPPLRLGIRPEITLLTLRRAEG